jgi:hypothetical protein
MNYALIITLIILELITILFLFFWPWFLCETIYYKWIARIIDKQDISELNQWNFGQKPPKTPLYYKEWFVKACIILFLYIVDIISVGYILEYLIIPNL